MKRFVVLDSFRGICAVAVVLFHTQILLSFSELSFFRHADLFVEFFFVLSGFVLFHAYGRRDFGPDAFKRFIISRTFRLYPLHLVMLLVFIGLEFGKLWAEHHGFSFNDAAFSGKTAPSEILPNALLLQSWIGDFNSLSFNTPAWSISIEYYLYMVLGLVLLVMPRYCAQVLALATLISFAALYVELDVIKPFIWRGASCFFAGALTYRLYERLEPAIARLDDRPLFTALEVLCLLLVYRTLTHETPHQGMVASLLFCAVVLVFANERGALSQLLQRRGFARLGELSFSIYLTHAAVIFAFTSAAVVLSKLTGSQYTLILQQPGSEQIMRYISTGSVLMDDLLTMVELGAVLAVSCLTYHYVELKGIELGRRLARNEPLRLSQV
ncbi:acyltransferase family protein [Stutzerimonas stutzeri]|uniref:Acyltransferase family protein n=1 Tax=Stutzerimonas stutzeri TaxID=316 RepID=A0A6I6LK97_STUST|nr:acyltransferase [Stutzerimonas stutzeri]QGZ29470.1 acyltransferase family protein [Stutzerimonas stutzeri]